MLQLTVVCSYISLVCVLLWRGSNSISINSQGFFSPQLHMLFVTCNDICCCNLAWSILSSSRTVAVAAEFQLQPLFKCLKIDSLWDVGWFFYFSKRDPSFCHPLAFFSFKMFTPFEFSLDMPFHVISLFCSFSLWIWFNWKKWTNFTFHMWARQT